MLAHRISLTMMSGTFGMLYREVRVLCGYGVIYFVNGSGSFSGDRF